MVLTNCPCRANFHLGRGASPACAKGAVFPLLHSVSCVSNTEGQEPYSGARRMQRRAAASPKATALTHSRPRENRVFLSIGKA